MASPALANDFLRQGIQKLTHGNFYEALQAFTSAIRHDPSNGDAWLRRAQARQRVGDLVGAETDYDETVRLAVKYERRDFGGRSETHVGRAGVRKAQGNLTGAEEDLSQAISLAPTVARHRLRAAVRASLGNLEGAIADYDASVLLGAACEPAMDFCRRGALKQKLGDLMGALGDYSRALHLDPTFAKAFAERASLRVTLGEPAAALSDYDQAIRLDPDFASAYDSRGRLRRQLGDPSGAAADHNAAARLSSKCAFADCSERRLARSDTQPWLAMELTALAESEHEELDEETARREAAASMELLASPRWQEREHAALALGALSARSAMCQSAAVKQHAQAVAQLLTDEDRDARAAAAASLASMGLAGAAYADPVAGLTLDKEWSVRLAALAALGEMTSEADAGHVLSVHASAVSKLLVDEYPCVRLEATQTLLKWGSSGAQVVAKMLGDEDAYVRATAARALGEMGAAGLAHILALAPLLTDVAECRLWEADQEAWGLSTVREVAAATLVKLAEPPGAPRLPSGSKCTDVSSDRPNIVWS